MLLRYVSLLARWLNHHASTHQYCVIPYTLVSILPADTATLPARRAHCHEGLLERGKKVDMTTSNHTPLRAISLREQARNAIRTSIVMGQIQPGNVESVVKVAAELGVSITPVREAVMDLANLGIVEVIRNKGFRVPVLTEQDLDEIFKLRTMLEVPAMREVAENFHGTDPEPFKTLAADIILAAREGDVRRFLDSDRKFHKALLETLGNHRLVQTVEQLRDQARMQGLQKMADHGDLTESAEEHLEILAAIAAGDGDLSAELMTRHLAHSRGIWADRPEPQAT